VKSFLSRQSDNFRPPYEKAVVDHPRSSGFVATCDEDDYLKDATGGRRFWPVRCGTTNLHALRRDRDQLWAEAQHRCDKGEPWWLNDLALTCIAEKKQRNRFQEDAWQPVINRFVFSQGSISVGQVLLDALNSPE
jgi:predicted P-loop ATPase